MVELTTEQKFDLLCVCLDLFCEECSVPPLFCGIDEKCGCDILNKLEFKK